MTLADVRTEHPLAMTTAVEVERVRAALAEAGLLGDTVRFAFFLPEEPPKADVLAFSAGDAVDRRVRVLLLDLATGALPGRRRLASTRGAVVSRRRARPGRRRASRRSSTRGVRWPSSRSSRPTRAGSPRMAKRGIIDLDLGPAVPAVGRRRSSIPDEDGRRMLRVLAFVAGPPDGPLPGRTRSTALVAYVDLIERHGRRRSSTTVALPVPAERGNFDDPAVTRPAAHRRSSRSRSPSPRARASPSTATRSPGRTGRSGSASTPARA